jgi:hypothetical protein
MRYIGLRIKNMVHERFRRTIFGLLLGAMLCFSALVSAANVSTHTSPEDVLKSFYSWYIRDVQAMKIPILNDRTTLKTYVSSRRIGQVDQLIKTGEYDADYFTKSQDVMDDWAENIAISNVEIKGNKATAIVVLGVASPWKLKAYIVSARGQWRIERVEDMNTH